MEQTVAVNGTEYTILKLLGKGKGGYSYLALAGGSYVVLKQIHHDPCDYYQFGDKLEAELRDYERLRNVGIPMPELLDVDRGKERIVKEFIEGETVYDLMLRDRLPETCAEQVRDMCRCLGPAGLNIDYFPTNFILREGVLYYIDYECNDYMEEWDFEHWGVRYWSGTPEFWQYARDHENEFQRQQRSFWEVFGEAKKMVLSTAAGDRVSSRMMSVIQMEGLLYFQTDRAFLKYRQLAENKNAALCMDNIQIEGICRELGHPMENERFAGLYGKHFPGSFERYSGLKNERLFVMSPVFIKRWIYRDGLPFEEVFEAEGERYSLTEYKGE